MKRKKPEKVIYRETSAASVPDRPVIVLHQLEREAKARHMNLKQYQALGDLERFLTGKPPLCRWT